MEVNMSFDTGSLNVVIITGRLGTNPELGETKDNKVPFAKLNLACTKAWKDKSNQRQEAVTWIPVLFWRKQAELAGKLLKKGNLVSVVGSLAKETWQNDGENRSRLYVSGQSFTQLSAKPKTEEEVIEVDQNGSAPKATDEDDLPS